MEHDEAEFFPPSPAKKKKSPPLTQSHIFPDPTPTVAIEDTPPPKPKMHYDDFSKKAPRPVQRPKCLGNGPPKSPEISSGSDTPYFSYQTAQLDVILKSPSKSRPQYHDSYFGANPEELDHILSHSPKKTTIQKNKPPKKNDSLPQSEFQTDPSDEKKKSSQDREKNVDENPKDKAKNKPGVIPKFIPSSPDELLSAFVTKMK